MHESLILREYKYPKMTRESIIWHGKEYFNFLFTKPEVSGVYEVLLHHDSKYKSLIERKMFIPVLYYNTEKNIWVHMNNQTDIPDIQIIGWKVYE